MGGLLVALFLFSLSSAQAAQPRSREESDWIQTQEPAHVLILPVTLIQDKALFQEIHEPLYRSENLEGANSDDAEAESKDAENYDRVRTLAKKLSAGGPLIGVRQGSLLSILPTSLQPGAKTAILDLDRKRSRKIVSLTSSLAAILRDRLQNWEFDLIYSDLRSHYDGAARQDAGELDASSGPKANPSETIGPQSPAEASSLLPTLLLPARPSADVAQFRDFHSALFRLKNLETIAPRSIAGYPADEPWDEAYEAQARIIPTIWRTANELLKDGPLIAIRWADRLVLLPAVLEAGARAASFALPSETLPSEPMKAPKMVELAESAAGRLREMLMRWQIGPATRLLDEPSAGIEIPIQPLLLSPKLDANHPILRALRKELIRDLWARYYWEHDHSLFNVDEMEHLLAYCEEQAFSKLKPGFDQEKRWQVWEKALQEAWDDAPKFLLDERGRSTQSISLDAWQTIRASFVSRQMVPNPGQQERPIDRYLNGAKTLIENPGATPDGPMEKIETRRVETIPAAPPQRSSGPSENLQGRWTHDSREEAKQSLRILNERFAERFLKEDEDSWHARQDVADKPYFRWLNALELERLIEFCEEEAFADNLMGVTPRSIRWLTWERRFRIALAGAPQLYRRRGEAFAMTAYWPSYQKKLLESSSGKRFLSQLKTAIEHYGLLDAPWDGRLR